MSSILIRRANMVSGGVTPRMPAGYTELAYLESDGNQYIDTSIIPTANTDLLLDIQLNAVPTANTYIFGRYLSNAQYFLYVYHSSSKDVYQWAWSCAFKNSSVNVNTQRHTIRLYSDGTTSYLNYDGTNVDSKAYSNQSGNTWTLTIFRGGSNNVYIGVSQKIYSCIVKNNGNKVRELVPAIRDSDNEVGMYDLVSNTFLTNAGSGTFSYGTL